MPDYIYFMYKNKFILTDIKFFNRNNCIYLLDFTKKCGYYI